MNPPAENHEVMLKESIKHFSAAYRNGSSDLSIFESIFFRKIQTMLDPPLEVIWFYSAVTIHSSKLTQTNHFGKALLLTKDLFRLLTTCSQLSDGSKKIALLAPVVYEVYNIVTHCLTKGLCLRKDVEDLIEEMVTYITVCYYNESENENERDRSLVCFDDLLLVWTIDGVVEEGVSNFRDTLRVFFPVVSDAILEGISERCRIKNLAGIVLFEVFLLRLCMKFSTGVVTDDMQVNLQTLAVQTIEGFKNCHFLDVLLRMLLEPTLSVNSLLSSTDAVLLRKILYDAVILIDYSFLRSNKWLQLHSNHLNSLALIWALVADAALQFAGEISDHGRTVSYANAFDNSHLLNRLIGWICSRAGIDERVRQTMRTPRALINWLYILQNQGLKVFDHSISTILNKVAISGSRSVAEFRPDHSKDVNMDHEMCESPLSSANPSVVMCMGNTKFTEEGTTRKRKEGGGMVFEAASEKKTRAKILHENAVICNEKFGGGSEAMDDDVEVMVTG